MTNRYGNIAFLVPGGVLLGLGLLTILAPKLVLSFMAAILIFFGVSVLMIGWRLFRLKRELDKTASQFAQFQFKSGKFSPFGEQQTHTKTVHVENGTVEVVDEELHSFDGSKITYH